MLNQQKTYQQAQNHLRHFGLTNYFEPKIYNQKAYHLQIK